MLERCRVLKDSSPQKKHGFTIGGYSTVQFRAVIIYMVHRGRDRGFPPQYYECGPSYFQRKIEEY